MTTSHTVAQFPRNSASPPPSPSSPSPPSKARLACPCALRGDCDCHRQHVTEHCECAFCAPDDLAPSSAAGESPEVLEDPVTDEQIRDLRASRDWGAIWLREFAIALGEATAVTHPIASLRAARARCAQAIAHRRRIWGSLSPSQRVLLLREAEIDLGAASDAALARAGLVGRSGRIVQPAGRLALARAGLLRLGEPALAQAHAPSPAIGQRRAVTQLGRGVAQLGVAILRGREDWRAEAKASTRISRPDPTGDASDPSPPRAQAVRVAYARGASLRDLLAAAEREILIAALAANGHNVSNTARELQIERSHLYKKMRALRLDHRADHRADHLTDHLADDEV